MKSILCGFQADSQKFKEVGCGVEGRSPACPVSEPLFICCIYLRFWTEKRFSSYRMGLKWGAIGGFGAGEQPGGKVRGRQGEVGVRAKVVQRGGVWRHVEGRAACASRYGLCRRAWNLVLSPRCPFSTSLRRALLPTGNKMQTSFQDPGSPPATPALFWSPPPPPLLSSHQLSRPRPSVCRRPMAHVTIPSSSFSPPRSASLPRHSEVPPQPPSCHSHPPPSEPLWLSFLASPSPRIQTPGGLGPCLFISQIHEH